MEKFMGVSKKTHKAIRLILYGFSLFLPWPLKRFFLEKFFGYTLHPTSRIGFSWIFPFHLVLCEHSKIGHFNVCKGVHSLELGCFSSIGKGNWITAYPLDSKKHFSQQSDRNPSLLILEHSAITSRHIIDCTNLVTIGRFSTIGGYHTQILTHSIDISSCIQSSAPIRIDDYCFVGTDCVLLGGSELPSYSVLGAKSLLNKKYSETYCLYGGVPAKMIKKLSRLSLYFSRSIGFVN
jgi:hypothetical protein